MPLVKVILPPCLNPSSGIRNGEGFCSGGFGMTSVPPPEAQPEHPWLAWIKQVYAVSRWGLTYSKDPFDLERYEVLEALSVSMMADFTRMDKSRIQELFANEIGYLTPKVDVRGVVFQ